MPPLPSGFEVSKRMMWAGVGCVTLGLGFSTFMDFQGPYWVYQVVDVINLGAIFLVLGLWGRGKLSTTVTFAAVVYSSAVNFIINVVHNTLLGTPGFTVSVLTAEVAILVFTAVAGFVLTRWASLVMGGLLLALMVFAGVYRQSQELMDSLVIQSLVLGGFSWVMFLYRGKLEGLVRDLEGARHHSDQALDDLSRVQGKLLRQGAILKQYVNPAILDALLQGETGEKFLKDHHREILTVAFVDICEFTRLSETLPPEPVAKLLNRYFDEIALETLTYGGEIDKFMGDAALLVFRGGGHLSRGLQALYGIMKRIRIMEGKPLWDQEPYPGVSAGLNSGEVICGTFGSSTLQRWDFTIIGDVVNTAARLEGLATSGQILVTEALTQDLSPDTKKTYLGEHILKNKQGQTRVWNLA